jgi:hypothetical protein
MQRAATSFVYAVAETERSDAMRAIWISGACLTTLVTCPASAQAQRWSDPNFVAAANVTVHRGTDLVGSLRHHRGDSGRHDRRHHGRGDADGGWWGGWYDADLNRSWDSDSYNDWWHDRPDRAYPRWVQHNEGCEADRMWQGGGVWRCSW